MISYIDEFEELIAGMDVVVKVIFKILLMA